MCNKNEKNGIISKCKNYADIYGGLSYLATGINIVNYGKILDCINYGLISTKYCVAGISSCCESGSEIRNCVNYGKISVRGGYNAGGIVAGSLTTGPVKGTVSHCINYGDIDGKSTSGGIAGKLGDIGVIEYCANFGNISTAFEGYGGGIVGRLSNTTVRIKNCYNTGDISSGTTYVGGITGTVGEIDRCYNIGKCFLKSVFYGTNLEPKELNDVKITNSYYLDQEIESGKTIDEIFMKSQEFVDMLNTDSETGEKTDAYVMDTKGINNGYPILKWQLEN